MGTLFQKLIPGNLNGKFMGKTGKFMCEYPATDGGQGMADLLNSQNRDIAERVDEILGNPESESNAQRLFISKEIGLDGKNAFVVMYHGFSGPQNKEIAAAVRRTVSEFVPSGCGLSIGKTYSVLNTELGSAEKLCALPGYDAPKQKMPARPVRRTSGMQLDTSLAPNVQGSMQGSMEIA